MNIIPAIDLKGGKCVRLYKGDFAKETVYFEKPLEAAKIFEEKKYTNLHIVDLDGALNGELTNFDVIKNIKANTNLTIQYGGGIRDFKKAETLIDLGIDRLIIGTMAITNRPILEDIASKYSKHIVIGLDIKNNSVAINGWLEDTKIDIFDAIEDLMKLGIKNYLITDISKDGTLEGPNVQLYADLLEKFDINIIASGGVSGRSDIDELEKIGIKEAVVGKALYENNLELK